MIVVLVIMWPCILRDEGRKHKPMHACPRGRSRKLIGDFCSSLDGESQVSGQGANADSGLVDRKPAPRPINQVCGALLLSSPHYAVIGGCLKRHKGYDETLIVDRTLTSPSSPPDTNASPDGSTSSVFISSSPPSITRMAVPSYASQYVIFCFPFEFPPPACCLLFPDKHNKQRKGK